MQITAEEISEWYHDNKVTRAYMAALAKEAAFLRVAVGSGALLADVGSDFSKLGQTYARYIDRAIAIDDFTNEDRIKEEILNEDSASGTPTPD